MSKKYLIKKLPKNPLARGQNFKKATKGALKLYPNYLYCSSNNSFLDPDSVAVLMFDERLEDLEDAYYDRDY